MQCLKQRFNNNHIYYKYIISTNKQGNFSSQTTILYTYSIYMKYKKDKLEQ